MQTLLGYTRQLFLSLPRRLNHACQNPGEEPHTTNIQWTRGRLQHPPSSHSQSNKSRFKVSLQIRYLAYRFRLPPTSGMWLVLFKLGHQGQQRYGPQSTQAEVHFLLYSIPILLLISARSPIPFTHQFISKP